ncbi:MAG: SDR family oxidoreductase [Campylobacter sp.]|nr:SDR family oxidoreductase [Campylobacter sp.]
MDDFTLISGASFGIGECLTKEFAKHSHNLVLVARSLEKLKSLKLELEANFNVKVLIFDIDLLENDAIDKISDFVYINKINIKYLVNSAGFGSGDEFVKSDMQNNSNMISLNCIALTKMCHKFLPDILKNGGGILNVASIAGFFPGAFMNVYYASKAYALSFSLGLDEECKKLSNNHKDRAFVSVLCPGPVDTRFFDIAGVSVFNKNLMHSPEYIAKLSYKKFMTRKRVIIPFPYNALVFMSKFVPQTLLLAILSYINRGKFSK